MYPNLPGTNKYSEYQLTDFSDEKQIKDSKTLFTPEKYDSIFKESLGNALHMDKFVIHHYPIYTPSISEIYPFLPNYPHFGIFGDWNNNWIKK
jgi:hypothetical protein